MAEFGVPAVLLKCHRNVRAERSHDAVWNIVGFMQSSMKLPGSQREEEESCGKQRWGVPWQLFLTRAH